jgi:flagellar motor switch protein FliG
MAAEGNAGNMSGTQRAAILLMSLGENEAAQVLKHMGAKEVQKLGQAMATMSSVTRDMASKVMDRFITTMEDETAIGVGAGDYVRKVLTSALGEDKAGGVIDRVLAGHTSKGLEALQWMEPRAIAELIGPEHPQIIAIVLAHLDADQAAEVLALLPENSRSDILMRIATLEGVQPHALAELDEIMEKQSAGASSAKASSVGGIKVAADIINRMNGAMETQIIGRIGETDKALSQKIQDQMFVFDALGELDDRSMQALLREVQQDKLGLALKGAEQKVRDKVFKNMSERASEMLREDMEAKGPVKVSDVEAAQKEILATTRRLAEAGTVMLGGKGEEFV